MAETKRGIEKEKGHLKVLIIDDNETDLKLLEAKLRQLGFRHLIKAKSGKEGVELAKENLPGLIFLDIIMPKMDGGKVKQYLREDSNTKDIPTIFLSSIISKDEEKRLKSVSGGHLIIAKPYSTEELMGAIDKALKEA
jgi:CheY-like chemotaxis protein